MRTTTVRTWGRNVSAYATRTQDGRTVVRVYDSVAGHYTVCHSLTSGQIKRVIARAMN
jgi:hypothetical protein